MSDTLPTKERLAQAIEGRMGDKYDLRAERMIRLACQGYYDDYESEIATPQGQLIRDFHLVGYVDMAQRAMDGEFECTKEEGEAWMQREGWDLLTGKKDKL